MTDATLTLAGVDHAGLAASARRWGWWNYAMCRSRREFPFLHTMLLTAFGNPILYLAAMGLGLGALVKQPVGGVGYLTFVAPALLVSTVATTGAGWGTWPIMSAFKWERTYLGVSATPVSPGQIAIGETVFLALRLLAQGAVFWLIGFLFGAWPSSGSAWTPLIGVLSGLAMFAPLMAYSSTLEDEGLQFNLINRCIVMPMFLFAGTFFPLEAMPPYLRWVGWISPMWHGTQLARIASYGLIEPAWLIALHVAFLAALATGGVLLAARLYKRRLVS